MKREELKTLARSRGWNPQLETIFEYLDKQECFEYGKAIARENES